MNTNLLINVQVYLLSHAVTRCCMIYFGNSWKIEICFKNKSYIKKSDVENLKKIFFIHGLLLYLAEKRKKIWGQQTYSLS